MTDEPKPSAEDVEGDPEDTPRDLAAEVDALHEDMNDIKDGIGVLLARLEPTKAEEPVVSTEPQRPVLPFGTYMRYRHKRYSDASIVVQSQHHQIINGRLVSGQHREMNFQHHVWDLTDTILAKWGLDMEVDQNGVPYTVEQQVDHAKALIERMSDFRNGIIMEDPWALPRGSVAVTEGPSSVNQPSRPEPIKATVVSG